MIFDVSTDRGIRSGNQTLTEIMYGLFLHSLGYAKDLDLSELEITLEEKGQLGRFEEEYRRLYTKDWSAEKGKVAFAMPEASRVLHSLDPDTYPMADSWAKAVKNKADISAGKLAERALELMQRRKPGQSLIFVVDEVGQFVARDVQKMLDLQAVVQSLGRVGRGKLWVVVTSQEKLNELVSGLDDKKIELARLMDRFPLQVHLEPSDISEVTSRRVLAKNAAAQTALGQLFDANRARFSEYTKLTGDIKLPELTRQGFIDLYPMLPYQIDLIIQVVSGLRTQGGSSKHVGGANRTIIKLAQQLLINPAVNLADAPIGTLARLDQVYDLVETNIASEVRDKIAGIPSKVEHPLAQQVAKAICLLQYVQSVHRTAENIAAGLHTAVDADSQLAGVKEAISQLEAAQLVRSGDDGYRIPTPAEDDWEKIRSGANPKPGDAHRLHTEALEAFWQPIPSFTFLDTKTFKGGLAMHGRTITEGDLIFHLQLADDGGEYESRAAELRSRSQQESRQVYWAVPLSDAIDRETVEVYRSQQVLSRKERDARTQSESALIGEERQRLRRHSDELRRLLRAAALAGGVYFRGNDRSPADSATDVGKAAGAILGQVIPDVFDRYAEGAAKPQDVKRGLEELLKADNLQGLPHVFHSLGLLRDENGKAVFDVTAGPLKEVLSRVQERANYGEAATGRFLSDEFAKEPFGWEFEVVRLLVLSLLRADAVEATSKGQTFGSATGPEAQETFNNNNLFRQASFRPATEYDFGQLVAAGEAFKATFGTEAPELALSSIAAHLRAELESREDAIATAVNLLSLNGLPGAGVLQDALNQMKAILRGTDENAVSTFNSSHKSIKEALHRVNELSDFLTDARLRDLARARDAVGAKWAFLGSEPNVGDDLVQISEELRDLLEREDFFRELPAIDQRTAALNGRYKETFDAAFAECAKVYTVALEQLAQTPGWSDLDEDAQAHISAPLKHGAEPSEALPIPQLRSDRDACGTRLATAIAQVFELASDGELVILKLAPYFAGGIETEEQLKAAIQGIREECERLIGAGKKIVVQ